MKISKFLLLSIVIGGLATSCEKAYVLPKPKEVIPIDPGAPPATVFYATDIQPIFNSNGCTGCHNGSQSPNLSVGLSHAALVPSYVVANSPSTSQLYLTLSPGGNMDANYAQISAAELAKIETWINEGARDN